MSGTKRIDVRWQAPTRLNGILERYLLYMSTLSGTYPGDVVYNSTELGFLTYRNESLVAGTTYHFTFGVSVTTPFKTEYLHQL